MARINHNIKWLCIEIKKVLQDPLFRVSKVRYLIGEFAEIPDIIDRKLKLWIVELG